MKHEWKPGDVGVSADGERFIVNCRGACFWPGDSGGDWSDLSGEPHSTDRPLVIIDPEDREQVDRLADLFRAAYRDTPDECDKTWHAMQAALREFAAPKPPKPEEPTDLGAVVRDDEGDLWQRDDWSGAYPWIRLTNVTGDSRKSGRDAYRYIPVHKVEFEGVTE